MIQDERDPINCGDIQRNVCVTNDYNVKLKKLHRASWPEKELKFASETFTSNFELLKLDFLDTQITDCKIAHLNPGFILGGLCINLFSN